MAKKRLFGNNTEPSCEICAYGKLSADASVVLCRRGGVTPLYHSCRHFRYDPLRRVPRRQKPLDTYDADAFSLNEPAEESTPVEAAQAPTHDNEMLNRLHDYLNTHETPDAQSILELLDVALAPKKEEAPEEAPVEEDVSEAAPSPEEDGETEEATVAEEDAVIEEETVAEEEVPTEEDAKPAFQEPTSNIVIGNARRATPETIPSPVIPDNTLNIFEDLKRLQSEAVASSKHAALQGFSFKLTDDSDDDELETAAIDTFETDLLTLTDDEEEDDDVLDADDLIITPLNTEAVPEETLAYTEDGSVIATTTD